MQPDPIETLDDFLSSDHAADDCMMIDELDGYLTAIIVSPNSPKPNEWMSVIWGETGGPHARSRQEAEEIEAIIQQMYDDTAVSLKKSIPFEPLFHQEMDDNGDPRAEPQHWCIGFLKGVALKEEDWPAAGREIETLLQPIIHFSEGTIEIDPMDHIQNLLDGKPDTDNVSIDDIARSVEKIYQITKQTG